MKIHDYRQLRAFIAAIAPLGLLTGCASLGDFEDGRVLCEQQEYLSDLNPSADVDYLALREVNRFGADPTEVTILDSWGERCGTAGDKEACNTALDGLPLMDPPLAQQGGFDGANDYDIAFTRADEVVGVGTSAELATVLGTIDTPSEAALLAFANNHELVCGEDGNVRTSGTGYTLLGTRGNTCGGDVEHYEIHVDADGTVTEGESIIAEHGDDNCAIGRRPDGLCSRTGKSRRVGDFFANATHLEAASVPAFSQLARELEAHGAPPALIRAAWRARADEIRHAHATARLARRFGSAPVRPRVELRRVRSLFEVARDNGVEGCVRETFGALTATVQAKRARSRQVRRAMGPIAHDETRHAMLSWAIDAWMQGRLTPRQRRRIAEERRAAVDDLRRASERSWSRDIQTVAGMPDEDASLRLLAPMDRALWQS